MQAAVAAPTDGPDEPRPGVFLAAVEARRRDVLAALAAMPARDRVAELIFDLISHLSLNAEVVLDSALYDSFARRHRLDDDDGGDGVRLPRGWGGDRPLRELLVRGPLHGPAQEAVNALLTLGYAAKLEPLDVIERRNFTLRVVAMLPGAERVGAFVLTDYLDVVCDEDDALRFWQIYVDRVAAEIAKRGGAPEVSTREPWLLTRLLALHAEGPTAPRGAWLALMRHVNRILQAHRHRWRFVRHLAEGCHEPRMLLYLCTSPAMVEDQAVIPIFLTRGNSKLVSCALLALHVYDDAHAAVDAALQPLRERPFPEIAGRLIEIYGQLHLLPVLPPDSALAHLRQGLLDLCGERIGEAPLDVLPNAVPKDSRSLRQNLLLVDVEPAVRLGAPGSPAFAQQYLERVVGTWLQTFTPSGVEHPLNDEVWRGAVRRALVRLLATEASGVIERMEAFAAGLLQSAERWAEGDVLTAQHLSARFVTLFGSVWLAVCRALCAEPQTFETGLACYQALIRFFGHVEGFAQGSGSFGALEYVLPSLYPDLLEAAERAPARVAEAAALIARVESQLHVPSAPAAPSGDRPRRLEREAPPPELPSPRPLAREEPRAPRPQPEDPDRQSLLKRRPTRESPLTARVLVERRPTGRLAVLLRAYTGLEVLSDLRRRLLALVGVRRTGRLTLTDREVVITEVARMGKLGLRERAESLALDDVTGVRVHALFRVFPLVLGGLGLAAAALLGGHMLFVGLRTGDSTALGWAVGLILGGLAFDAALTRLGRENARAFLLELHGRDARQTLRLLLDAREGAPVLDAFMAHDAARRELEQLKRWERPEI